MAYLINAEDLSTHLYPEIVDTITRSEGDIVERAISSAIAEAKSYLSRFDLPKLFGSPEDDPEIEDEHLKNIVKDIACWQIIKLANPNINLELFRTSYEDAIKFLDKVMKGQADPEGWVYKSDNPDTPENENTTVQWSSNKKRIQHF